MKIRSQRAQTLPLVTASIVFMATIGIGFYAISLLLGGGRELQNAVDAGNLNVVKRATKSIGVDLKPGFERDNFAALVDKDTRNMNLLSYNRAVGQAMLVAANAAESGTPLAKERARQVIEVVQTGDDSIGARLKAQLEKKDGPQKDYFAEMAGNNSLRMLGNSDGPEYKASNLDVGFLKRFSSNEKTAATNISINKQQFPALAAFLTDREDPAQPGSFFVKGYDAIKFEGIGTIQGVTLNPGQGAHLVSKRAFEGSRNSPYEGATGGLPPNSFRSVAAASLERSDVVVTNESTATVGALDNTFTASLPGGYITIRNLPGIRFGSLNASVENPLNNELFEGVTIADNNAFSTDEALIRRWAEYNQMPEPKQAPSAMNPPLNGEGIFDEFGNNASMAVLTSIKSVNKNCPTCTYLDFGDTGAQPLCMKLYPSFFEAYGAEEGDKIEGGQLIAVEKVKADVIAQYYDSWTDGAQPRNVPAPCSGPGSGPSCQLPPTGLRKFDRNRTYICLPNNTNAQVFGGSKSQVTSGTVQFTKPGTIREYLAQVGIDRKGRNTSKEILKGLKGRLRQIKPDLSKDDFNDLIDMKATTERLDLDNVFYIYLDPLKGKLTISQTPPKGVDAKASPVKLDGNEDIFTSRPYSVIGTIVNPQHEIGIHFMLFSKWAGEFNPLESSDLRGEDEAIWTASSGFRNALGELQFRHRVLGSARFSGPN